MQLSCRNSAANSRCAPSQPSPLPARRGTKFTCKGLAGRRRRAVQSPLRAGSASGDRPGGLPPLPPASNSGGGGGGGEDGNDIIGEALAAFIGKNWKTLAGTGGAAGYGLLVWLGKHIIDKIDKFETSLTDKIDKLETSLTDKIDKLDTSVSAKVNKLDTSVTEFTMLYIQHLQSQVIAAQNSGGGTTKCP